MEEGRDEEEEEEEEEEVEEGKEEEEEGESGRKVAAGSDWWRADSEPFPTSAAPSLASSTLSLPSAPAVPPSLSTI